MFVKRVIMPLVLLLLSLSGAAVFAAETKEENAAAALKEGNLYIYSSVGQDIADPLVKEFQSRYPGIKVDFITMPGNETFNLHMRDIAARKVSADVIWSREIPLQAALVKSGYSLPYRPAEADSIMPWAVMGDVAYATAFEPVVMVYNRKFFAKGEYPATHKGMPKAFKTAQYKGRIGTCDPEKSEPAFLFLTQDYAYGFNFWERIFCYTP